MESSDTKANYLEVDSAAAAPRARGRILHVLDSVLPFFRTFTVKDAASGASLYKARVSDSKPILKLSSNGQEIGQAVYAGDALESCTAINMSGQQFEMRWDQSGPGAPKSSQYWSSPTFAGTHLTWEFTDMSTSTCCMQGDTARSVAILRRKIAIRDVAEIEILEDWPAGDIDEIVMMALVSFQRFRRMLAD